MNKQEIPEGAIHRLDENKTVAVSEDEAIKQKLTLDIAEFQAKGGKIEVLDCDFISTRAKKRFNNSQITSEARRKRATRDSEGRFA